MMVDHHKRFWVFSGVENGPVDTTIPCEYCDQPVSIHDLELHTVKNRIFLAHRKDFIDCVLLQRRCAEDTRRRQRESQR